MTQTYRLNINDITHNQLHTINFPGTKTISEVKRDVSDLTNIAVRYQIWSGWPPQMTDDVSCDNRIAQTSSSLFIFAVLFC